MAKSEQSPGMKRFLADQARSVAEQRATLAVLMSEAALRAAEYQVLLASARGAFYEDDEATLASDLEQVEYCFFAMAEDVRDLLCAFRGHA